MIVTLPGNHDRKAEFRSGWLGMSTKRKEADLPGTVIYWSGD